MYSIEFLSTSNNYHPAAKELSNLSWDEVIYYMEQRKTFSYAKKVKYRIIDSSNNVILELQNIDDFKNIFELKYKGKSEIEL